MYAILLNSIPGSYHWLWHSPRPTMQIINKIIYMHQAFKLYRSHEGFKSILCQIIIKPKFYFYCSGNKNAYNVSQKIIYVR
jgi:hypothetical protein